MPGRFQVLSLDGGGAKALFTAAVLDDLERDHRISIADCFDLIVGTSAGGIVALGLGSGVSPAAILEHFRELNRQVFPTSRRRNYGRRLLRPAYDPAELRRAVHGVLGDRLLAESSKRLLIPAYDVGAGQVHIFKTPHHERFRRDGRVPMVDVALATSAAPTYFPAHRGVQGTRLIDGGVWANNPSGLGIAEAISVLDVDLSDVHVLSIGTTDEVGNHSKKLDRGGWVRWGTKASTVVLTASSRGMNGLACHLIGDRFVRFDAHVPQGTHSLDKVDAEDLSGIAANVSRKLGPTFDAVFASHLAAPYQPHPQPTPGATR
jgi:patatin-like phospholipase/acyl hydrolase